MQSVSIKFEGGKLSVRDEAGKAVATSRATVYLVNGNDCPVALLAVEGTQVECNVHALDVPGAGAVVGPEETVAEGEPKKK